MKKQVKIISVVLMTVMIIATLANIALAANDAQSIITAVGTPNYGNTAGVQDFGSKLVGIIQVVGIVIAVVVLMIIGIKYMMGSAEEKAEYKKTMIPYVVGAILIFAATTIVNVVYQIATNLTSVAK